MKTMLTCIATLLFCGTTAVAQDMYKIGVKGLTTDDVQKQVTECLGTIENVQKTMFDLKASTVTVSVLAGKEFTKATAQTALDAKKLMVSSFEKVETKKDPPVKKEGEEKGGPAAKPNAHYTIGVSDLKDEAAGKAAKVALGQLQNVSNIVVNMKAGTMTFAAVEPPVVSKEMCEKVLNDAGFKVTSFGPAKK